MKKNKLKHYLNVSVKNNIENHTDVDDMPPLPDATFDTIMDKVRQEEKPHIYTLKRRRRLILAAALISALLLIACGVYAVRVFIYNTDTMEDASGIKVRYGEQTSVLDTSDQESYRLAGSALNTPILVPGWLPDDFEFETASINKNRNVIFRYNSGERFIEYSIELNFEQSGRVFDTKSGSHEKLTINNNEIDLFKIRRDNTDEIWYTAYWSTEKLTFNIDSNIPKDELIKFIENLEEMK